MESLLGALLVLVLRIMDVSLGTIRVLYAVRGQRLLAAGLGLFESLIFIFAISRVISAHGDVYKMIAYAAGFASGNYVGITLERWIGSGWIMVRLISRQKSAELAKALHESGFGITTLWGKGHEMDVAVLFVVAPRRRGDEIVERVRQIDPETFITTDSVNKVTGGYTARVAPPSSVRK